MELQDNNGQSVAKTQKGQALNEVLTEPFGLTSGINKLAGYGGIPPLHPNYSEMLDGSEFTLQDYFVITNSGKYFLKFQMNVIWFPPNWKGSRKTTNVPMASLPPVEVTFEISETNSLTK